MIQRGNKMEDSYFTLSEAQFITGINRETVRRHIHHGWILAERTSGRLMLSRVELLEYAVAKWDEGRLYMMPPECWQGRIEAVMEEKRAVSELRRRYPIIPAINTRRTAKKNYFTSDKNAPQKTRQEGIDGTYEELQ